MLKQSSLGDKRHWRFSVAAELRVDPLPHGVLAAVTMLYARIIDWIS